MSLFGSAEDSEPDRPARQLRSYASRASGSDSGPASEFSVQAVASSILFRRCPHLSRRRPGVGMEYRQLGRSGLRVPALSLGTATFGGEGEFFRAWGANGVAE